MVLWRLGRTVGVRDVAAKFGVAEGTVENATFRVVQCIRVLYMKSEVDDHWPVTPAAVKANSAKFEKFAGVKDVVAALDGIHVRTARPAIEPHRFVGRDWQYSLSWQVCCDADYNVIWLSGHYLGSADDSTAMYKSDFPARLAHVPQPGIVIADEGYASGERLLVQLRGLHASQQSLAHDFNTSVSRTRGVIEKVFGVMKARFRWMLWGIHLEDPDAINEWMQACVILHNMINRELREYGHDVLADEEDLEDDTRAEVIAAVKAAAPAPPRSNAPIVMAPADAMEDSVPAHGDAGREAAAARYTDDDSPSALQLRVVQQLLRDGHLRKR